MNNKYVNRSKISEAKFRELIRLFVMDLTAMQISKLSGLNRNTINRYLKGIRQRIAEYCEVTAPLEVSKRKLRNSEDIQRRVIGVMEKQGMIYSGLLKTPEVELLEDILNRKRQSEYLGSDEIETFELLIEPNRKQRIYMCNENDYRKNPSKYRRMEGFWGYSSSRLEKFKGLHDATYLLHLKECEFRFNNNQDDLYSILLRIIRNKPLF